MITLKTQYNYNYLSYFCLSEHHNLCKGKYNQIRFDITFGEEINFIDICKCECHKGGSNEYISLFR